MRAILAAAALFSCAAVSSGGEPAAVHLRSLHPGQTLEIRTEDRIYRVQLVDRHTGKTVAQASDDGVSFSAPRTVYLLGATPGPEENGGGLLVVRMHEIQPGLKLELGVDGLAESQRRITTRVQSVRVLPPGRSV